MILVACGSAKATTAQPPRKLYSGSLFLMASKYAASTGEEWRIVSALHGALLPDGPPLEPYNFTMKDMTPAQRKAWGKRVAHQVGEGPHVSLMGAAYDEPLLAAGVTLERPLEGVKLGFRMQWLKQHTHEQGTLL